MRSLSLRDEFRLAKFTHAAYNDVNDVGRAPQDWARGLYRLEFCVVLRNIHVTKLKMWRAFYAASFFVKIDKNPSFILIATFLSKSFKLIILK